MYIYVYIIYIERDRRRGRRSGRGGKGGNRAWGRRKRRSKKKRKLWHFFSHGPSYVPRGNYSLVLRPLVIVLIIMLNHICVVIGPKVTYKLHIFNNHQNNTFMCMEVSPRIFKPWFTLPITNLLHILYALLCL